LNGKEAFSKSCTVKTVLKRALCAALPLCLYPAAAAAETPPAIATGLAIPAAQLPSRTPPIPSTGRVALVDAATARLFMIENGAVVDSMRVIVGKRSSATPVLRSTIYYATLNPYWNVPVDLARTIIAPRVLKDGPSYLSEHGYQVVSKFGEGAEIIPASRVNWKAVAAGTEQVFVRQLPGPGNSMGQMKFGFANGGGIYLHDTPKKELFEAADRSLSNGCVRLEDAPRFARWLLGRDPAVESAAPEQYVPLPAGVPIIITYLDPMAATQIAALR
jgi:murein L,D-transpeptidase YcbB/YkuD